MKEKINRVTEIMKKRKNKIQKICPLDLTVLQ